MLWECGQAVGTQFDTQSFGLSISDDVAYKSYYGALAIVFALSDAMVAMYFSIVIHRWRVDLTVSIYVSQQIL